LLISSISFLVCASLTGLIGLSLEKRGRLTYISARIIRTHINAALTREPTAMTSTPFRFEHTVETSASPEAVFALYDPLKWTIWDHSLSKVELDGPFVAGTTGRLTVKDQGDTFPFTLTDVRPGRGFTDETLGAGGAVLRFEHELFRGRITHRVIITGGPPEFAQQVGPNITHEIPSAMRKLAELAELAAGTR
jgi:hypothetical protein